jgi:hypothetical protein
MYKHRYLLSIILAILLGLVILTLAYAENCVSISREIYDRAIRWGYQAKVVVGKFKDVNHCWVEYFAIGKWRVWDEAIKSIGKSWYTAEELGYTTYYIEMSNFNE